MPRAHAHAQTLRRLAVIVRTFRNPLDDLFRSFLSLSPFSDYTFLGDLRTSSTVEAIRKLEDFMQTLAAQEAALEGAFRKAHRDAAALLGHDYETLLHMRTESYLLPLLEDVVSDTLHELAQRCDRMRTVESAPGRWRAGERPADVFPPSSAASRHRGYPAFPDLNKALRDMSAAHHVRFSASAAASGGDLAATARSATDCIAALVESAAVRWVTSRHARLHIDARPVRRWPTRSVPLLGMMSRQFLTGGTCARTLVCAHRGTCELLEHLFWVGGDPERARIAAALTDNEATCAFADHFGGDTRSPADLSAEWVREREACLKTLASVRRFTRARAEARAARHERDAAADAARGRQDAARAHSVRRRSERLARVRSAVPPCA